MTMYRSDVSKAALRIFASSLGLVAVSLMAAAWAGCGGDSAGTVEKCEIGTGASPPDYLRKIGCRGDFDALSSQPLDTSIPGARSGKVVLDQLDPRRPDSVWFQNSEKYKIHHSFASKYLSGPQEGTVLPIVPALGQFNRTEYSALDRRFILGSVTYYEGPKVWALELAPYDTASVGMIQKLYDKVKAAVYFGAELRFHPTSESLAAVAKMLPASVKIVTTEQLFAGVDYQPLNLGTSIGKLRFVKAAELDKTFLNFRDIVVLDHVPNDISVVIGMITEEFQTPLSHVNVLAQNRKTPNMGLRRATMNAQLLELDGKWVELTVGAFDWNIREKSQAEADDWWAKNKPAPVEIPAMDLTQTELKDVNYLVDESGLPTDRVGLGDAIKKAILAYGGKAANYGVLANTPGVPVRKGFAIPVYYYDQFMRQNGFYDRVDKLLADTTFQNDPAVRFAKLAELRADMMKAPVDATFSAALKAKLAQDYPGLKMRFRTSTNAEDQENFLCAGCYDSHTGDPSNWDVDRPNCHTDNDDCSVLQAIRKTWSTVWYFRTFEERAYNSIDQKRIGMALLVHHNFPDEEANGVAVTANIFDPSGLEPGFYVNVQWGGAVEVVAPPPGVSSDEILIYQTSGGFTPTYLGHSNLVPPGTTVLTPMQVQELASALALIQQRFSPAYGPLAGNKGFYGLEVDFKFDDEDNPQPGLPPRLLVKQARNYRGRGGN